MDSTLQSDLQRGSEMGCILVIEDEEALARVIALALKRLDIDAVISENGDDGIRRFEEGNFDLVITDIHLPGTNGNQIARHIRRSGKPAPIIGISGTPWIIDEGVFDAVLTKPFSIQSLLDVVESNTGHSLSTDSNCWRSRGLETPKRPIAARR
jgi:DNA-binding response OmpR family regulator